MANVLSIQSQVVWGHVGNSAAAFALQRLGHEVWQIPTVLLSHHPGHGNPAGQAFDAGLIDRMVDSIAAQGVLAASAGIISGYAATVANAEAIGRAAALARAANPSTIWLCDPVFGDFDTGIYVEAGLPDFYWNHLMAGADIATPNQFELGRMTGIHIDSLTTALRAIESIRAKGPAAVVATSVLLPELGEERIGTLAINRDGAWLVTTPRLDAPQKGTGDVFAALLLGHLLNGREMGDALAAAVGSVYRLLGASVAANSPEMLLVEAQAALAEPASVTLRRLG
ncbi:pyridoxal kinase [Oceanibacterium hippocampi]|uniref:pyridoxal kinase n=1 Tax=Oceanibacterium hippocampi TaxID=745714 RepID=A0A1Y5RG78_9PROT|nr:pyridoxal kinase [Oceanibacterium hippocampi]SLN14148.1 Pyridoxamine kinase [Oceanibacterium hippocampi]